MSEAAGHDFARLRSGWGSGAAAVCDGIGGRPDEKYAALWSKGIPEGLVVGGGGSE